MKKILTLVMLLLTFAVVVTAATVFAESSTDGWCIDYDGEIRYYVDDDYLTDIQEINGFWYVFDDEGVYQGVYDGHTSVGTKNVPCTSAYDAALAALGSENIFGYYTFDTGETYKSTNYISSNQWRTGDQTTKLDRETVRGDVFTKHTLFTSTNTAYLNVIQRYSTNTIFRRTDAGGGNAIEVKATKTGGEGYIHSYLNPFCNGTSAGDELVIEAEFKLGEHYDFASSLFQVIDRNNVDTGAGVFMSVLSINPNGGIYYSGGDSEFICILNKNEFTRLSVSIHPSTNTFDVYVNGLLIKAGLEYVKATNYTAENLEVDEVRFARFDAVGAGSMMVDNIAIYKASKPVCTTTAATVKNGVYKEGGVLRYYNNNMVAIGTRLITFDAGVESFDAQPVFFGDLGGNGGYLLGNNATVKVSGVTRSSETIGGNVFIAPDAVDLGDKAFGGWRVTDGDKVTMLYPGQVYSMAGDIVCEPFALDFSMLDGASVRTTEGSTGIRFMAKVKTSEYETLVQNGIKIEPHILIVPTAYLDKTYGYTTIEALKTAGYTSMIDIKSTAWYSTVGDYYYYTGSVSNILPENYMLEYSGIAYLKLTYPDGSIHYEYADYNEAVNSRSVYYIAHAAYNDRIVSAGSNPDYSYGVTYNGTKTYSPYNSDRLAVIKGFADRVVMLESDRDNVKVSGDFYNAPYSVSVKYNASTKKNDITVTAADGWAVSDAFGAVLDGKLISDYTVSDKMVFSVDAETIDFASLKIDSESYSSWSFMDASKDYAFFPKGALNTDKTYCAEGASDSAKWVQKNGWTFSADPKSGATLGAYTPVLNAELNAKVYDMTDLKALTFAVHSAMGGQTLLMLMHSENSETDGIDYFSYMLELNAGWNYFAVGKHDFNANRSPLGWDKITSVNITGSGWDQANNNQNVYYFSDIIAHDSATPSNPFGSRELANAAVFTVGGYYSGVNGVKYKASVDNVNSTAFEKNGVYYLPIGGVADSKGMTGEFLASIGKLYATYGGKSYVFTVGSRGYTVDGAKQNLKYAPQVSGDAICFAAEDVMSLFGYTQKYVDRMGLVVLSDTKSIYDQDNDFGTIYKLIEECIYVRPSGEQIVSDLNEHSDGQHPYLMIDEEGFDKLRYYAKMDPTMQGYIAKVEASYGTSTGRFTAAPNTFQLTDGLRLLAISRDVMNKTIRWALLSKLYEYSDPTLARTYAERCWDEIEAACNFKNPATGKYSWHPDIFLDTSELAYPVAICYDWLYDYWIETDEELDTAKYTYAEGMTRRKLMEDSLYWMALATTSSLPSDTTGRYDTGVYNLSGATNNWNGVCNGGMMAAALAICNVDRYSENVKTFLNEGILGIESGMWVYAPDGGYEEGPGYWSYGTTYAHVFMSCLNTACGTNYGVYNAPGFAKSVYFTTYMGSKNTSWGFHDGGSGSADTGMAAWFGKMSNDPNVNAIRRQAIENGWKSVSMYDVMYFEPHIMTDDITLNLDSYYSLDATMTFRSNWNVNDNIMTGLHGGDNAASHGDLDIGNFVINVNGVFMIGEMGSDAYNVAGYFGVYRWSYYRKRAEGQNTLVMLPSAQNVDGTGWNGKTGIPSIVDEVKNTAGNTNLPVLDQTKTAVSKMLKYVSGETGAIGVVDMAPAYAQMTSGKRGLLFTDNRSTIIIQDEAVFSEKMDIWWFAHTEGDIEISEDGRSAIISRGGALLYAEIVTNMSAEAKFTKMAAESLDQNYVGDTTSSEYYDDDTENPRESFSKLCVKMEDTAELKLAVAFTLISSPNEKPAYGTTYAWQNIDSWTVD